MYSWEEGLTEGLCEPHWLVIVDDGHAQSIQAHHAQNDPVEALSFHHATDEEADPFLFAAEVRGAVHFTTAFHAGSTERRARRSCREGQKATDFHRSRPATTTMKLISQGLKASLWWSVELIWKKILHNSALFKVPKLGDGLLLKLLQEQTHFYG